jgi:hypothetical protein
MQVVPPLWKTVWKFPIKLNITVAYCTAIPHHLNTPHTHTHTHTILIQMFVAAWLIVAKASSQLRQPSIVKGYK